MWPKSALQIWSQWRNGKLHFFVQWCFLKQENIITLNFAALNTLLTQQNLMNCCMAHVARWSAKIHSSSATASYV